MSTFEFETDLQVRFRDVDAMHHVNNAVYATYLEQARVDYYADVLDVHLDDIDTVLVSLDIEYERQITLDDDVSVAMGVRSVGESSVTMAYEVRTETEVAATAETVQVYVGGDGEGASPLPSAWVARMDAFRASEE
jgi:acyl-CoA thioester hydrolase